MREILFRAKRLTDQKWAYGDFTEVVGDCPRILSNENVTMYAVDPETVGQYTGLKDKNGKKIFEGDIVKIPLYESIHEQVIAVVAWDIRKAVFYLHGKRVKTDFYHYFGDDCEVIGNIHDDYNRPLEVRRLCFNCHRKWHKEHDNPELIREEV